jgi:hypothetical protein
VKDHSLARQVVAKFELQRRVEAEEWRVQFRGLQARLIVKEALAKIAKE